MKELGNGLASCHSAIAGSLSEIDAVAISTRRGSNLSMSSSCGCLSEE